MELFFFNAALNFKAVLSYPDTWALQFKDVLRIKPNVRLIFR